MDKELVKLHKAYLLVTKTYDTKTLVKKYPPNVWVEQKQVVFDIAMSGEHNGNITFSKYKAFPLPNTISRGTTQNIYKQDVFEYPKFDPSQQVEWHINFADENLFGYYGGPLFAQDELQVHVIHDD